jgi:hypothetical protein
MENSVLLKPKAVHVTCPNLFQRYKFRFRQSKIYEIMR